MKKIYEVISSTFQRVTMDGSENLEFELKEFCNCGNKFIYSIECWVARQNCVVQECSKCKKRIGYRIKKEIFWKQRGLLEECPICDSKNIRSLGFTRRYRCCDCNIIWKNNSELLWAHKNQYTREIVFEDEFN